MGCRACDHDRRDHGEGGKGPCMKPHKDGLGMCGCYGYIPLGRDTCDNGSCPNCRPRTPRAGAPGSDAK
jgi:hypothetical protein